MTNRFEVTPAMAYGYAGHFGNKYWMSLPADMKEIEIESIVAQEARNKISEPVHMNGKKFKANELTFFVYIGRNLPQTSDDSWVADRVRKFKASEIKVPIHKRLLSWWKDS